MYLPKWSPFSFVHILYTHTVINCNGLRLEYNCFSFYSSFLKEHINSYNIQVLKSLKLLASKRILGSHSLRKASKHLCYDTIKTFLWKSHFWRYKGGGGYILFKFAWLNLWTALRHCVFKLRVENCLWGKNVILKACIFPKSPRDFKNFDIRVLFFPTVL